MTSIVGRDGAPLLEGIEVAGKIGGCESQPTGMMRGG